MEVIAYGNRIKMIKVEFVSYISKLYYSIIIKMCNIITRTGVYVQLM